VLIEQSLGEPEFPKTNKLKFESFDDCHRELQNLESYFHMSAEDFDFIRQINAKPEAKPWEWEQGYSILEKAYIAHSSLKPRVTSEN